MVARNVRVEFVHGPYDGCHSDFQDVLLRNTIELPIHRLGIEVERTADGVLAIYKLDECARIQTPQISTTVLRYQHTGFKTRPRAEALDGEAASSAGPLKRGLIRAWQRFCNWMLAPVEYPMQLASRH
jgi:hypothetical protein